MLKIAIISAFVAFGGLSASKCTYNQQVQAAQVEVR